MTKLHFIRCDFGELGTAFIERDLDVMDRENTLRMLAEGQFEDVIDIIEVDLIAGTSRDVTTELMAIACPEVDTGPGKPSAYDIARDLNEAYAA